jgi:hypothetical protein
MTDNIPDRAFSGRGELLTIERDNARPNDGAAVITTVIGEGRETTGWVSTYDRAQLRRALLMLLTSLDA